MTDNPRDQAAWARLTIAEKRAIKQVALDNDTTQQAIFERLIRAYISAPEIMERAMARAERGK